MTRRISRPGDEEGVTGLMKAVSDCNLEKARALIMAGENLQARDRNGRNVLYHAFTSSEMTEDTLAMFELLGEHGMDFNTNLDTDGCSALITAIALDWPIIVQLLISLRTDIHDEGMPKFGASVSTDMALNRIDNAHNADNQRGDHDRFIFSKGCSQYVSPLLCATMLRRHAIVDILMSAGADCQQTSMGSFWKASNVGACSVCDVRISPVHIVAYHGDVDLLQQFLAVCQKRCLEESNNTSRPLIKPTLPEEDITPLWLALLRGETAAVKTLLEFEHPRAPPCHFGSGLYISLEEGYYDNAHLLLKSGYDLWDDLEWIESELYPTTDKEIIEFINDFVSKPPTLLQCSRNALRQHMGSRISAYLSTVKVPQKVANVILLKDVLYGEDYALFSEDPASCEDVIVDV